MTREERYRREADARARVGAGPDCPLGYPPAECRNEWERRQQLRREAVDALKDLWGFPELTAQSFVEAVVNGDVPRVSFNWD